MNASLENRDETAEWASRLGQKLLFSVTVLPLLMWLFPSLVPFKFFEFWRVEGDVFIWFWSAWPMLVGALIVNLINEFIRDHGSMDEPRIRDVFLSGVRVSLCAGIFEEILFRWLFFFQSIFAVKLGNFLFFGFIGFGFPEFFFTNVFGPIADWVTFHQLGQYLFHETGWAVGAAMLAANAFFRDGHKYQGLLGYVNSWLIGMYLFWIMFQYGLPIAILAHFAYDFMVFCVYAPIRIMISRRSS